VTTKHLIHNLEYKSIYFNLVIIFQGLEIQFPEIISRLFNIISNKHPRHEMNQSQNPSERST